MAKSKKKPVEPEPVEEIVVDNLEPTEWKTEGHPWVDKQLRVACTWPVPTSKNTASSSTKVIGTVQGFAPVEEQRRLPAMGRFTFEPPPQPPTIKSEYPKEGVKLAMDLTGTEINDLQRQSQSQSLAVAATVATTTNNNNGEESPVKTIAPCIPAGSFPNSTMLANVQERYQRRLEHDMKEHILPPLIALAALEEATVKLVKQRIAQEEAEHQARAANHAAKNASSNNNSNHHNTQPHPPQYYTRPPNAYLSAPVVVEEAPSQSTAAAATSNNNTNITEDPTKEHLMSTPANWMARIKMGCTLAYNEYLTQQQQSQQLLQLYATTMADDTAIELSTGRRSSSRIARITTEQQQEILEQQQKQRKTRRGSSETSLVNKDGVEIYLQGHRIARFLQQKQLEAEKPKLLSEDDEEEKETNEEEEEEDSSVEEEEAEEEDEDDIDLFNPYLQPTYGDILKCLRKLRLDDIQSAIPYWCQETTNRTPQHLLRKQLQEGDENEMENVLEVPVLPLDALTLGIPEKTDEEGEEEAAAEEEMETEETPAAIEFSDVVKAKDSEKKPAASVPVKMDVATSETIDAPKPTDASKADNVKSEPEVKVEVKVDASKAAAPDSVKTENGNGDAITEAKKDTSELAPEKMPSSETNGKKDAEKGAATTLVAATEAVVKADNSTEITSVAVVQADNSAESTSKPPAEVEGDKDASMEHGEESGGDEEAVATPTESVILTWEVPESIEKAPARKHVHKHLQSQDHYTFGKYSFWLRRKDEEIERLSQELVVPTVDETEEELIRKAELQAKRKAAERAFQDLKAWDKWRFEGIHGGHTVWPRWQDAVKTWQAERNAQLKAGDSGEPMDTSATASANADSATGTSQEEADRAKALELAQKEKEEEAAAASGTGAGRRTRRKATASAGVFYGQSSQMSPKQLVELILRLCSESSTAPTILHLQSIVAEDGTQDPVRRLRSALGKLVWRRNQLARLSPSTEWTEKYLVDTVREKPLLQVAAPDSSDGTKDVDMKAADGVAEDEQDHDAEAETLVHYIRYLNQTELLLRKTVLEHLTDIPIPIVATAADEKKNSNEGYDAEDFEDQSNIDWQTEGHELIGKHIFRPRDMGNTNDLSQCEWFTIQSYVPSIPSENDNAANQGLGDSPVVDRRMRFRAAPFLEDDNEPVEFTDEECLVLTEAQTLAGMKAAELEQVNLDREIEEEETSIIDHPFSGAGLSARITLYPIGEKKSEDALQFTVVGHDSIVGSANVETIHRILVLSYPTASDPTPSAVWATLDVSDDTEIRCQLDGDKDKSYRIQQSDFHPDSQAFAACRDVVAYLEKHQKAAPFLEPVDHVALNIPDYPKVIANPMDISTLSSRLESGHYSNVPPKQSAGRSPVSRMLNGHFRDDVELIFDNAMLFNPPKDWIHESASALKKAVSRKMDSMSQSADTKFRRSGRNQQKQSIYFDEDSDVDMYEYESDNDDDDDYGGSRRKRNRKGGQKQRPKADDNSTRAMEHPVRLQKTLSETVGLRGPFANFQVEHDASSFAFPSKWSCRRRKPGAEKQDDPSETVEEEEEPEAPLSKHEKDLVQLVELQRTLEESESSGLRRSTRATIHEESSSRQRQKKGKAGDMEYFTLNEFEQSFVDADEELSKLPRPSTRQDVEVICEKLHDAYYAKLHKVFSASLEQAKLTEEGKTKSDEKDTAVFGSFSGGLFPPYLGRMVPVSLAKHGKFAWQIRAPFQIPALRWVIRGLIQSGHLGEVEPLVQDSMSSGTIMTNHVYYTDSSLTPFEVLDSKELARRRRANNEEAASSEDEVELSEYEKLRAERVARNAERLKALGLG